MRKRLIRSAVTVLTAFLLLFTSALVHGEATSEPGDTDGTRTLLIAFATTNKYKEIEPDYLALSRLLAAQALTEGDGVKLVRLNEPNNPRELDSGVELNENLQNVALEMRKKNESNSSGLTLMKGFCDKLEKLVSGCSGPVDLWLLSPDARLLPYSGARNDTNGNKVVEKLTEALSNHSDLTLHLVWQAEEILPEGERYLDEVLKEQMPEEAAGRLIIHVLPGADGDAAYGVNLYRSARALNVSMVMDPATAASGRYDWRVNGQDTLLQLSGVSEGLQVAWQEDAAVSDPPRLEETDAADEGSSEAATTTDLQPAAAGDAAQEDAPPQLPAGVTLILPDKYVADTAWIMISGDCPAGTLTMTDSQDFRIQPYTHQDDVPLLVSKADGALQWYREDNQLRLSADIPEAMARQAIICLGEGENSTPLDAVSWPYADGVASWTVTIPAQGIGDHQLVLTMRFDSDGMLTLRSEPVAVTVTNRPPVICEDKLKDHPFYQQGSLVQNESGCSLTFVTYSNVPGGTAEGKPFTLDLSALLTDPDGDVLTFNPGINPGTTKDQSFEYSYDEAKQQVSVIPQAASDADRTFTLTVDDGHGGTLTCQLNILQRTVANQLRNWTLVQDPASPVLAYNKETQLTYTLPAEDAAFYETLVRQYQSAGSQLPALADGLKLTVTLGDAMLSCSAFTVQEDDSLQCQVTLPAYQALQNAQLKAAATLNDAELKLQIDPPTSSLSLTNDPPELSFTPSEQAKAQRLEIDDMPDGSKVLNVPLPTDNQQTGDIFVPASYFTDDHGILQCSLQVVGSAMPELVLAGDPEVVQQPVKDEALPESTWRWDLDAGASYILRVHEKGNCTVKLWASDGVNGLTPSVTWNVSVSSKFTRMIITAVCITVAVIAIIVLLLILWQHSRPSFNKNSVLCIELTPFETGSVSLGPCRKNSVSLARVMISCQLYPPRGISMDALNDIELAPAKRRGMQVRIGRRAAEQIHGISAGTTTLMPGHDLRLSDRIHLAYIESSDPRISDF